MILDTLVRVLGLASAITIIGATFSKYAPSYLPPSHPVLMSIGTLCFFTQGVVAYTANFGQSYVRRQHRRGLHAMIQLVGFGFTMAGFMNIVAIKKLQIHSSFVVHVVFGYLAIVLMSLQFLFGWLKFRKRERDGEVVYKFHSQMGPIVYVVALLAIVFGCTAAFWEPAKGLAILILILVAATGLVTVVSIFYGPRSRRSTAATGSTGISSGRGSAGGNGYRQGSADPLMGSPSPLPIR